MRFLEAAAFFTAAAAAVLAALECRSAGIRGRPGADARVWAAIAAFFLVLAAGRIVQLGPWLGMVMRQLARDAGAYQGRRPFQIAATVTVAFFALAAMAFGLRSIWDVLKRYRLAAGCVSLILASGIIRFISLHEVDAWNRRWSWIRVSLDLAPSSLAAVVALVRARQAGGPGTSRRSSPGH